MRVLEWQSKVWASYSSGNAFPSLHPWGGVGWPQNRCGWCKQVSCGMSSFSPKRRLHDSHRLISFKEGSESVSSDQQNCIPRFQTPEASASNYGQQSPKHHAKCRISLRRANLIGAADPHAQGHNEAVAGASREADLLQWQFFTEDLHGGIRLLPPQLVRSIGMPRFCLERASQNKGFLLKCWWWTKPNRN